MAWYITAVKGKIIMHRGHPCIGKAVLRAQGLSQQIFFKCSWSNWECKFCGNVYSTESQLHLLPTSFGPPGAALNFSSVKLQPMSHPPVCQCHNHAHQRSPGASSTNWAFLCSPDLFPSWIECSQAVEIHWDGFQVCFPGGSSCPHTQWPGCESIRPPAALCPTDGGCGHHSLAGAKEGGTELLPLAGRKCWALCSSQRGWMTYGCLVNIPAHHSPFAHIGHDCFQWDAIWNKGNFKHVFEHSDTFRKQTGAWKLTFRYFTSSYT